jgi:hypothetical protein
LTLLLVVGLLAAACSDSADTTTTTAAAEATTATTQPPATTQAPEASDEGGISAGFLTGSWRGDECICTVVYGEDGTYQIIPVGGDTAVEQGDFVVDGTSLTFISSDKTVNCDPGDRLSLRVEVLAPSDAGADRIRQTLVEDDCSTRGGLPVVTLTRLP